MALSIRSVANMVTRKWTQLMGDNESENMQNSLDETHPTVFNRIFTPTTGQIIYHYCSSGTFLSIIRNNSLWLSDANMMNDAEEGRYGYAMFEQAATDLLKNKGKYPKLDGLTVDFFNSVDDYLSPKQLRSHSVITCFSKQPDILSQWRAYAHNAQGWAIGFYAESIAKMPVTLLDVLYDPSLQLEELKNTLSAMYILWRERGGDFRTAVGDDAAFLACLLLAYKDPSFSEEQEVRALHELRVDLNPDGWLLSDEGGTANGEEVRGQPVKFRSTESAIIPYIELPLSNSSGGVIAEVWLGPRNPNRPGNAIYPLTQFGHRNVKLRRSTSPYRG
jgi:hypothetical protein